MSQGRLLRERRFLPFFVTQFFGAFNDNALKFAIVILAATTLSESEAHSISSIATALLILPYFFLSATAGQLAEKMEKARLIRLTKMLEVVIAVSAAIAFVIGSFPLLLGLLFLLGMQATLFGPVKYAILPQVLRDDELVGGNGLVEMGTYVAILTGQIAGAELVSIPGVGRYAVGALLIVAAFVGYGAASRIPEVPSRAPDLVVSPNVFVESWRAVSFARETRSVWLAVLGISWFWLYAALIGIQLPNFMSHVLGGNATSITMALIVFSFGIGIGSVMCERLSSGNIELGLVPVGSFGLTLFGIDLYLASAGYVAVVENASPGVLLGQPHVIRVLFDFAALGFFGGLYSVPLFALMQHRSEPTKRSRIIAGNNIINSVFIIGAAVLSMGGAAAGLSNAQVFLLAALLNAVVAIYIFTLLPEFLLRFLVWILVHTMYRTTVRGANQVPREGAALVVANHVSFVDAFIVSAAIARPIRFVMYYRIYRAPILNILFRWARAIPIASVKEDPALMERAFAEVEKALAEGELVGIFPEGIITYSGDINSFRPGVERILAKSPVPVVPLALRGLWGSWFSRRGGRAMVKVPRRFWSKIEVAIGPTVPASEATAQRLETEVRTLRGDAR